MTKTFCDNCGKEIRGYSYIFGYNACFNPVCEAKVTLLAYKHWKKQVSLSNVPRKRQVEEAERVLSVN